MCGWVGIFGGTAPRAALEAATDTLATRGPDGSGTYIVEGGPLPLALGHRRLAILDLSPAGAQPMHDPDQGTTVVYNGEIYNSPDLRRELEARGIRFRSTSDTEVLLRGWAEWGDRVLDRIEGIFSFALVDVRRGRALLARDRLGVKPLYWYEDGGVVVAGSAPRAILALRPDLQRDLDSVALAQFLTLLWIPHPRTPWERIRKLAPGSAVAVQHGRVREWRYWTPPASGSASLPADVLADAVAQGTERQLLSDVPVGLLLSGGLDSALLLSLMARHYEPGRLHAITAGYDERAQRLEIAPDDTAFARRAATAAAADLCEVVIDGDPLDDLDALSFHFDDPVADPAAISLHRLSRASPTKVLLSGVGAEELFGGYPRHLTLATTRRAAALPASVRRAFGAAMVPLRGGRPGPAYALRRNVQKVARAIGEAAHPHYWRLVAQLTARELSSLVPGGSDVATTELDALTAPLASVTMAEALAFDREQFLPNLNLAYVDKAAMASGIEIRVPLLDERVTSAALVADPTTFLRNGVTKVPLRDAARALVDPAIIDRPKTGFGGPARAWFRGDGGQALLARIDALADTGVVARGPARRVFDDAATGRRDSALAAWALVCLQSWHDRHVASPQIPAGSR